MAADARDDDLTSVVIVAADSGPMLIDAVNAALASSAPVEIIVVDNASSDGTVARLESFRNDARVRVVENASNIGFGPACNRGMALARGGALLFLNPDCLIESATVASLRNIACEDARIGLLGIDVRAPDGTPARGNRRREPTLRRAIMTFTQLARFESRWPPLAGVEMPAATSATPAIEDVEAVSGACLFLPRRAFEAIGGFDEAYFLHVEDLDLARRVRDAGYRVAIAHALRAVHAQGTSSRHRPVFVAWHKHRGMWRYFRKFDPAAANAIVRGVVWIALWAHFALMSPFYALRKRASPES